MPLCTCTRKNKLQEVKLLNQKMCLLNFIVTKLFSKEVALIYIPSTSIRECWINIKKHFHSCQPKRQKWYQIFVLSDILLMLRGL